ncbi:MAG: hypothetical protein ACXAC7_20250 [Candidatus Hodarchaeales archaeon]|jgi:hypothetical protein
MLSNVKYQNLEINEIGILLIHAFIGWALCGATMGIGMSVTTTANALIIHAIAAPIIFFLISLSYFSKFNYTSPLNTAIFFTSFIILMDFFVVSLLIEKSFEMFMSPLGTWIPFMFIFTATLLTGTWITNKNQKQTFFEKEKENYI